MSPGCPPPAAVAHSARSSSFAIHADRICPDGSWSTGRGRRSRSTSAPAPPPTAAHARAAATRSSTATASAVRSRVVVRIRAGTWAICSVNVRRAQSATRQRHRRLRHRELTPTRQVPRAGQHPVLARRRTHPAHRAPRRVRITGDQLHDLDPGHGEHDTLHRQTLESQQTRRIIATVNHGPWLSSRCSKTQRGSRSRGPPSFRRAGRVQPQVARSRSKSHLRANLQGGALVFRTGSPVHKSADPGFRWVCRRAGLVPGVLGRFDGAPSGKLGRRVMRWTSGPGH